MKLLVSLNQADHHQNQNMHMLMSRIMIMIKSIYAMAELSDLHIATQLIVICSSYHSNDNLTPRSRG